MSQLLTTPSCACSACGGAGLLNCYIARAGYQTGKTFLVDRHVLNREFTASRRRKERLDGAIDQLRRHQPAARVSIPVPADVFSRKLKNLSEGVALEAGHLHVIFSGAEELLGKLYELAQVASNDFERFRTAAESVEQRPA
jgi:hypothetical protein